MMKKLINSFDIFDTLIGRLKGSPDTIFDQVSIEADYPNYKHIRKLSESKSDGTWDGIWNQFKSLSMMFESQVEDLKNLEWSTEKKNSFPITTNIVLLQNKYILVSDMYLPENFIRELLSINYIDGYEAIYVSPNGKRSGTIWKKIEDDGYRITLHTGDNIDCDILSPKKYKIPTSYFDPKYSQKEVFLFNNNKKDLANLLRIIRLSNIYTLKYENKAILWHTLSNILPICRIVFGCENKEKYIARFPDLYYSYENNFDAYINTENISLIAEMNAVTDFYAQRLKIDYNTYDLDDDILFYLDKYCEILPNDVL